MKATDLRVVKLVSQFSDKILSAVDDQEYIPRGDLQGLIEAQVLQAVQAGYALAQVEKE